MTARYTVRVSSFAADQLADYAFYIAKNSGSHRIADRWVESIYQKMKTLERSPRRYVLAEESQFRPFDIHRQIIGNYLTLYTVDDEAKIVQVVGFRHARKLPRSDDLA